MNSYVLITPARNEEANIERVITSVIKQTVLPIKWVIVSDGSTDSTDDIVRKFIKENPWIELFRMPEHADRQFAAKVNCFNAGYNIVKGLNYDIIANLDADISFENDYIEFLLLKFKEDQRLGVAGTPFVENGKHYDYRFTNIEHVSGACQLFRRECFEEIGGYIPIKGGGIDWVAVTTARMNGWKTRTFTEKFCLHHRNMGTGNTSPILTWFRQGQKDYFLGNHPFWETFRILYQMTKKPFIIGGSFLLFGFVWASLKRVKRPISKELIQFIRSEQMIRLKKALKLKSF
ncbi:MAG: glycosyltransferase family 2 protein [Desulfobacterium sp.]|nr:glycosyltransferase family 2 protein [Desulfobacterium sp.]MBU3946897.1 glycosyltransferase family 2 protein [Pseudomonadota bacterium]MBU4036598.1 glycosyltransferase family 2 protein [Pseudomonadota bacterium]